MTQPQTKKPKIGLVIGSGGLKCSAALGMWKVLEQNGIGVDMAVGCSGGSIFAAGMALGWDVNKTIGINSFLWEGKFSKLDYSALLGVALPQLGFSERTGLLSDTNINEAIQQLFENKTFAHIKFPLFIIATDLKTGREVVITEGRIDSAVRASISIPMMLPAVERNGQLLIDGGLCDPLPISIAIREGCDIILAMGFDNPEIERITSFAGLIEQSINIMTNNLLKSTFAFYNIAHHAEVIPMMPNFDRNIGLGDVHLIPYIIEAGEKAAQEQMPYLKRLIEATRK